MIKRLVSFATVVTLFCCFTGIAAYAKDGSETKEPAAAQPSKPIEKAQPNEKLKADVAKLVADAKAGKLKVPVQHFPQPKRNNLSTGAKIAIIAGIAGAIIFTILWYTNGPGSD